MTDQIENITIGVSVQTRETRYSYDAMGDVTQEIDAYGTSLAATTITDYDVNGHLTEEIDPSGNTTLFKYDASGNETWTQNAMGYTSTMQYDGNNHLTSEVDADGRLQTFTYNAQGLETGNVWFAGGTTSSSVLQSISFGYDANGNETFASDNSGAYTLSYNPLGQVTKVIEPVGGGVTLSMGYDGSGNRTLLEDSTGGTILSTYDTANGLTTEIYTQTGVSGALRIDQQYDWLGRVVEQERYSDAAGTTLIATTSYEYNAAGQITDLNDDAAGTLIASYSLGYDGAGELTQQTINGTMTTLTYDQLGELTSGDGTSQTYTSGGNRTTDTTIAGNEVTYDGTYSYAYDPQGNETLMYDTTTATTWAYTYDNDNQMTKAVETVSSTTVMEADYQYGAFGNMTEEEVITYGSPNSTAITQYVIDSFNPAHAGATGLSGSNVLADLNGGGTLMTHYVWGDGIDQLFGRYDAGGTLTADPAGIYGTMTDQNGSLCDVIDNTGTLQVAVSYDAWGNILTVTGPGVAPLDPQYYLGDFTYDTYDYDAATGYYDVNARVYSSASGRWLSQDPMGFDAGDSNLYRYVNNRPTEATDPSGEFIFFVTRESALQWKDSIDRWYSGSNPEVYQIRKDPPLYVLTASAGTDEKIRRDKSSPAWTAAVSDAIASDTSNMLGSFEDGIFRGITAEGPWVEKATTAVTNLYRQLSSANRALALQHGKMIASEGTEDYGEYLHQQYKQQVAERGTLAVQADIWLLPGGGFDTITSGLAGFTGVPGLGPKSPVNKLTQQNTAWGASLVPGPIGRGPAGLTRPAPILAPRPNGANAPQAPGGAPVENPIEIINGPQVGPAGAIEIINGPAPTTSGGTVRYFRVQGGTPPNASRQLIRVDAAGNVTIQNGTLNVSAGTAEHARYFQQLRPGSTVTEFQVPSWLDEFIQAEAIPQRGYRTNPLNQGGLAPKIVDPTTPGRSYELPSIWAEWLQEYAVPGSGRVLP